MVVSFFIFTPIWGNDPILINIFSDGLVQPPTSNPLPEVMAPSITATRWSRWRPSMRAAESYRNRRLGSGGDPGGDPNIATSHEFLPPQMVV